MLRLNRSAHAPKGTAFFLFLGLVIVPLSLGAAGFQVSFSPSLSAASDAWHQIADVFGAGYRPAGPFDSSAPGDSGRELLRATGRSACPRSEFACAREFAELSGTVQVSKVRAAKTGSMRGGCPKAASRASATATAVVPNFAVAAPKANLENHVRALQALTAFKLETVTHKALLKNFEKQIIERSLAIPQSLMMFVRLKSPTIPSATKAAECKVRAALDSARRLERERTMLTGLSSASPYECEL
ncbi:MAG: hypothetical protein AABN33_10280 [Acidobacteriota bacterium]